MKTLRGKAGMEKVRHSGLAFEESVLSPDFSSRGLCLPDAVRLAAIPACSSVSHQALSPLAREAVTMS